MITSALAALCSARTCRNSEWLQTDLEISWRVVEYNSFLCHILKVVPYLKIWTLTHSGVFWLPWHLHSRKWGVLGRLCWELGRKKYLMLGFSWHYLYCQGKFTRICSGLGNICSFPCVLQTLNSVVLSDPLGLQGPQDPQGSLDHLAPLWRTSLLTYKVKHLLFSQLAGRFWLEVLDGTGPEI